VKETRIPGRNNVVMNDHEANNMSLMCSVLWRDSVVLCLLVDRPAVAIASTDSRFGSAHLSHSSMVATDSECVRQCVHDWTRT